VIRHLTSCLVGLGLWLASAAASHAANPPEWTEPFPPFKIAGNLYYVGSKGLANYLVATPQGHILINSDLEESVPLIRSSVEKLGFRFEDIKILLLSHAHWDHDGGSAGIKKLTGATYMVMDADVPVVESGGKADFHYGDDAATHVAPARVDRVLHDDDEVKLGGAVLTAHLTPGHTKGCTTWTMKVQEGDRSYDVVIVGGPWVQASEQHRLSGDCRGLSEDVPRPEVAAVRHPARRARQLLRPGDEIRTDEGERRRRLRRSRGLPEAHRRRGAGLQEAARGAAKTADRRP
jgi:hypothetical protein